MKISFEIFSIPEENLDELKREISAGCGKYLYNIKAGQITASLRIQEGTCPLTGKRYLSVIVDGLPSLELARLNEFSEYVYSFHPLKNEPLVRDNRTLEIQDAFANSPGNGQQEDELECWVCGRLNGEERFDYDSNEYITVEVSFYEGGPEVPLCTTCMNLFTNHDIWKQP